MASNLLSTESILQNMANALPTHAKDDTNSDLSSSYEAIGLFTHACMIAVGFRLIGFGERDKMEEDCQKLAPRLSEKWNSSFDSLSFLYAHNQSSMQYVVKVDRLGGKADIRGIGLGDERIARLQITAKDYVSSAALPLRIPINGSGKEDRSNLESKLKDIFVSPSRIHDLASEFQLTIIQKLMPNMHKEGYEEFANAGHDEREDAHAGRNPPRNPLVNPGPPSPAQPYPFRGPLATEPRRQMPPGDFPPSRV